MLPRDSSNKLAKLTADALLAHQRQQLMAEKLKNSNLSCDERTWLMAQKLKNSSLSFDERTWGATTKTKLFDIETTECEDCGVHEETKNMYNVPCTCKLRVCPGCYNHRYQRPKCLECLNVTQGQAVAASHPVSSGPLTVLFDLNGVFVCAPRGEDCFGCPLSQRFSEGWVFQDPLPSMVANSVPLDCPFGQSPFQPLRKEAGFNGIPSWLYVRPGVEKLLAFLEGRQGDKLQWGICSTMTFRNAAATFRTLMQVLDLEVRFDDTNKCKVKHRDGLQEEIWFFTQEECVGDGRFAYHNGNSGHAPSPDVAVSIIAETGGRVAFVLPTARKARFVHENALLVKDFRREDLLSLETGVGWQEGLQTTIKRLVTRPDCHLLTLLVANRSFVERKRGRLLREAVAEVQIVVDFLESRDKRSLEIASRVWQLQFG